MWPESFTASLFKEGIYFSCVAEMRALVFSWGARFVDLLPNNSGFLKVRFP